MFKKPKSKLNINFCGVEFENPFILAAAPPTDKLDMVREGFKAGWAGAVLKTTSKEATPVRITYPIIQGLDFEGRRVSSLANIDLISEYHIDEIEKRVISLKKEFPTKRVIVSITGQDEASWKELARRASESGADMVECSFSCPQGTIGLKPGAMLAQDAALSAKVASWVKEGARKTPVVIKLTPLVNDIAEIAMAVCDAGADAVCVGNSFPSLIGIDINNFIPFPNIGGKSTYSGLSGTAIKPVSLRCIAEVAKAGIAISGSGGPVTWRDAVEFMLAGASVVQFCTAVMRHGYDIIEDLIEGLHDYLDEKGISSPSKLVGRSCDKIVLHDELPFIDDVRSRVDLDLCVRCEMCHIVCRDGAHQAITINPDRTPKVDDEKCVGCGLCASICPVENCITMRKKNG
ncbi:MAG: NAD-dependent dihydropyrimidine dehydrogenase subunit PreA [Pseudomonadota bacterium]